MMLTLNRNRGFTIVELLVAIVVIAIIASISVTAFSGMQARARDAQRVSEISTLQKKLELYYAVNSTYPTPEQMTCGGFGSVSSGSSKRPFANFMLNSLDLKAKSTILSPSQENDLKADPSNENFSCYYHGLDQCDLNQPLSMGASLSYRTTDLYQYCTLRRNGASWVKCYGNVDPTERCDYYVLIFNLEVLTPQAVINGAPSRTDYVEQIK